METNTKQKYKRGDVVHLNSDKNVLMTVSRVTDQVEDVVTCEWLNLNRQIETFDFWADCITLVVPCQ